MGEITKIQWANHTFNPWRGCTKIAPGCVNCYADAQSLRNPKTLGVWGPNGTRVVASEAMWREPVKWDRLAEVAQHAEIDDGLPAPRPRPRVFCASLADVFEDWPGRPVFTPEKVDGETIQPVAWYGPVKTPSGVVDQVCRAGQMLGSGIGSNFQVWADRYRPATLNDVRARLFRLIDSTPNLDWLLLTKRPENVRRMWCSHVNTDGRPPSSLYRDNVWLGTSIACQEDADRNVPELLKCRDLAAKLFLSIEPMTESIDLEKIAGPDGRERGLYASALHADHEDRYWQLSGAPVDWVIVGGESGPNARPCDVEWIRSIVAQCNAAGVPCFVKQLGAAVLDMDPVSRCSWPGLAEFHQRNDYCRALLRGPKGGDPAEWPEDLRVREVPT
jgi:protein gp37